MVIHLGGLKNLNNPGVWVFPRLSVCLGLRLFAVYRPWDRIGAACRPYSPKWATGGVGGL